MTLGGNAFTKHKMRALAALVVAGVMMAPALGRPASAAVPSPLPPDLVQELPDDLEVRAGATQGQWLLRFGSTVVNRGRGPLSIAGARTRRSTMAATQVVASGDGVPLLFRGVGTFRFRGRGGHAHWHFLDFDRFELVRAKDGRRVRPGRKTGFCVGDELDRRRGDVAEAPTPVAGNVCGFGEPGRAELLETMSVGFAQRYEPGLAGQHVDLTGLPAGRYRLRHVANPDRDLLESDYSNNVAAVTFELRWPRDPKGRPAIGIRGRSRGTSLRQGAYRSAGAYLDYAARPKPLNWPSAGRSERFVDPQRGIRVVTRGLGIDTYSAVEDAVYGLWHFSQWTRSRDPRFLREARRAAGWLSRKQGRDGTFRYNFEYSLGGDPPLVLRPGWYGAISQGLAASLWSRLYRVDHRRDYIRRARLSLRPFTKPAGRGGTASTFLDTDLPWFEGYATLPSKVHTLGHFLPALVGLYDMSDMSPTARSLFERSIRTLPRALPYFDTGARTTPWLAHLTAPVRPVETTAGTFQEQFVAELHALDSVRPNASLRAYRDRWERQLRVICRDPAELCQLPHR